MQRLNAVSNFTCNYKHRRLCQEYRWAYLEQQMRIRIQSYFYVFLTFVTIEGYEYMARCDS
jgi:hypothetical protein